MQLTDPFRRSVLPTPHSRLEPIPYRILQLQLPSSLQTPRLPRFIHLDFPIGPFLRLRHHHLRRRWGGGEQAGDGAIGETLEFEGAFDHLRVVCWV